MADATLQTDLGRVLVTGGSGFVGANLVTELLERGLEVRAFDRVASRLPEHPRLEVLEGDITDTDDVAAAVDGVDTVFHTAAIIDLMGGGSPSGEARKRSFAVNVTGTENLVHAAQKAGVQRFVYTASNSVVMGGQEISGGDETLPYTDRFADLYTETKVVAEKFVLGQNGEQGMLTCSIRPSGIWGRGDQTMFRKVFESVLAGHVKVLVGSKEVKLDNSYVHNLVQSWLPALDGVVEKLQRGARVADLGCGHGHRALQDTSGRTQPGPRGRKWILVQWRRTCLRHRKCQCRRHGESGRRLSGHRR